MKPLVIAAACLWWATSIRAKAVFAHFMHQVTNSQNYTASDWEDDITQAQKAHIEAFALNMAYDDPANDPGLEAAFAAASGTGFQLFFSFDYAGNGPWPMEDVISLIATYSSNSAYYHYNGQPFVSTFEGPGNAADWITIKADTGCFFMPDWSSLGAEAAVAQAGGVADGLFSWSAWPWGPRDMDTYVDASYLQFLNGKPYMMPVSPWFYTNLPGYNKNWLWRGDHIWADRWIQAMWWQPEFIEIISWNDYGESHYIGPVRQNALAAFSIGEAPYLYDAPHDGWREILPFAIDMYKNNQTTIVEEGIVVWARPNSVSDSSCDNGDTTANTATQLQIEFEPSEILYDAIFFAAVLGEDGNTFSIKVGGKTLAVETYNSPEGGAGLWMGYANTSGAFGAVEVSVDRGGQTILILSSENNIDECFAGEYNGYNPWVASEWAGTSISVTPPSLTDLVCVNGTGLGKFDELCTFTCSYGYCPQSACHCTRMGQQRVKPTATSIQGYPIAGEDDSFDGLCSFGCTYGFCPSNACGTVQVPLATPTVSDFQPPACIDGDSADAIWFDLCSFTCKHGFCPINVCTCSAQGDLNLLDPTNTTDPVALYGDDWGLCQFACDRNYCPPDYCSVPGDDNSDSTYGYGPDYNATLGEYVDFSDTNGDLSCDPSLKPSTLDDLISGVNQDSIPALCWDRWALGILLDSLLGFQDSYNTAAEGYDSLFGYYQTWVKDSVEPTLDTFMTLPDGPGNAYFDCDWLAGGTSTSANKNLPCNQSTFSTAAAESWTIQYTLTDADGFWDALSTQAGIQQDWVTFGDWTGTVDCVQESALGRRAQGPGGSGGGVGTGGRSCVDVVHKKTNVPIAASDIVVTNPKTVIQAAMPNITALTNLALSAYFEVMTGANVADVGDIVTAVSAPVFMLQNAVTSMASIKQIGAEAKQAEKTELIVEILGIVLMVVPIIGEGGGALFGGIKAIAEVAELIGQVGNAALTAYSIVKDPSSAPFEIMGLLLGSFGSRSGDDAADAWSSAATARRGLSASDLDQFGDTFVTDDDKVQSVLNACRAV
ncbi:glycosyl hydrolase family 71-domain-containing protein [Xylariales sp. PMI_506]|nr:glycosyl hydrolase family 71-domain-containing protein [Xylariales sp. PMI_506]